MISWIVANHVFKKALMKEYWDKTNTHDYLSVPESFANELISERVKYATQVWLRTGLAPSLIEKVLKEEGFI